MWRGERLIENFEKYGCGVAEGFRWELSNVEVGGRGSGGGMCLERGVGGGRVSGV